MKIGLHEGKNKLFLPDSFCFHFQPAPGICGPFFFFFFCLFFIFLRPTAVAGGCLISVCRLLWFCWQAFSDERLYKHDGQKKSPPVFREGSLIWNLNSGHACLIIKDFHDIMIVDAAHEDVVISFQEFLGCDRLMYVFKRLSVQLLQVIDECHPHAGQAV